MSSKANKSHKDDSRLKPTCTRCRNHGIYFVPLKGHRNVCPFKLCCCKDCALIFERRQVVVKPQRQTDGAPNKSNRRKRTLKELEDHRMAKEDGALIPDATMSVFLPPSLTKRKEPVPNVTAKRNQRLSSRHQPLGNTSSSPLPTDERFFPECASLTNPPLSYGYTQSPRGVHSFPPRAPPPSVVVNMPGLQRMVVPERPGWIVGYPALSPYSSLYHQAFVRDSSQMDVGIQSPSIMY